MGPECFGISGSGGFGLGTLIRVMFGFGLGIKDRHSQTNEN